MKKVWAHKCASFKEAEEFDRQYYFSMSPAQRLETMQLLRQSFFKLKGQKYDRGKRLRRVIKIIQQA